MNSSLVAQKYVTYSGGGLLLYDYMLTLSLEVEYIWKAPWTAVKVGFLLNRYGNLLGDLVIVLEETGILSHGSQPFCVSFFLYCSAYMLFSGESIRLIVIMRAWAVWGCTYRVAVGLVMLYIIYIIVLIAISAYLWVVGYGSAPQPIHGVCIAFVPASAWLLWVITLAVDSLVLAVALQGLRKSFHGIRGVYASPLARLLVHDAVTFYAASMFNSVFALICWTVFQNDPRDFLELLLSIPIMSIAGQRLILNLRGLKAPHQWTSRDVSRVVDQELAAMDDDAWQPESGSSNATGTLELVERSAQFVTFNEASMIESQVTRTRLDGGVELFDRQTCQIASNNTHW